jgi:hypothetical protein
LKGGTVSDSEEAAEADLVASLSEE